MEHIVIPYRHSDNDELRYVLRSIEKYCNFDYDITIIGDKPKWATNINHIPYDDTQYKRYENLYNKINIAINHFDSFFWWHDDEFVLKPVSVDDLKEIHFLQDLKEITKFGDRWFQQELKSFREDMEKRNMCAYNYCTHIPFYFESDKMRDVLSFFGLNDKKEVVFIENYYYNYDESHKNGSKVHPIKVGRYGDKKFEESEAEGKRYLNFDEAGIKSGIFDFVKKQFDQPSKFEK